MAQLELLLLHKKICWPVRKSENMWCGGTHLLLFTAEAAIRKSAGN